MVIVQQIGPRLRAKVTLFLNTFYGPARPKPKRPAGKGGPLV